MTRIEKLNLLQSKAVDAWINTGGNGTLFMSQRTGKGITSFKCIYAALEKGFLKLGDSIRYRAEVSNRKTIIFEEERKACIELLGKDPFKDFNISFATYQSGLKEAVDMEVFDEIDWGLSEINSKVIRKSTAKLKLGLTGTVQSESNVNRSKVDSELLGNVFQTDSLTKKGKIGDFITKGQMLSILLPICFEYPMYQAISDGLISPFETYILHHTLGTKYKYLKLWKNYPTLYNELDYYTKNMKISREWHKPAYVRMNASRKNTQLLYYNMESKKIVTKELLKHLDKTILFSVGKSLFEGVTENIASPDNVEMLLSKLKLGEINTIASSKMIARGATVSGLNNCIFMSFYSKQAEMQQRLARVCSFQKGKVSKVFFFLTAGTYEEKWMSKLQEIKDSKGKVIHKLDLNVKKIISTKDIFKKGFKI